MVLRKNDVKGENVDMPPVKVGLVCVGLEGERNDLAARFRERAVSELKAKGIGIVNEDAPCTLTHEEVKEQSIQSERDGADAILYLIGTWILANHVIDAIARIQIPFAIWGIPEPASFSSVGANVVHGSLGEMGIKHRLFYGQPDDGQTLEGIVNFARAAAVKKRLRSCRLGMIGGRTISAYPTMADAIQIKQMFGIEVEHIDQLVLLEKAKAVTTERCDKKIAELSQRVGSIEVPEDMLRRAVSVYFALKEMIAEYELDMVTVKCIGEFMDRYSSCCIALAMLNDEGILCTCQCNLNATISAYILSRLSEMPVFFGDINVVVKETKTARLINCGSIPIKLAQAKEDVKIVPQYEYMGAGRGACTFFCCKSGAVTFGTLGRVKKKYVMNIATGSAFLERKETLKDVRTWAQGFVHLDCDPMVFYENLRCNHSVMCYGNEEAALLELCALYDIQPETTTR